ncbi:MAG: hypothetical protein O3A89_03160 [Actinomycetota bacterium]|jgi:hypothetical protein|nr:hypothetical protein [Actinomycetota bacterium]
MTRRLRGDRGSAGSLTLVLLVPVFCVLATMAVQAAMWGHTRSQARAVAHATAVMTARGEVLADSAVVAARASLDSIEGLDVDEVTISFVDGAVVAVVAGRAPGLIHGLASSIRVVESSPLEGWRP